MFRLITLIVNTKGKEAFSRREGPQGRERQPVFAKASMKPAFS
ncbi:MAG: hypothetical protein WBV51_21185 [Pseudolabrys sp.]